MRDEYYEDHNELDGDDLSDDPMLQADPPKSRRLRRRERAERKMQEKLARERNEIRREIIAELKEEGVIDEDNNIIEEQEKKEAVSKKKKSRFPLYLMTILSGNILSRSEARRAYPYMLLVSVLAFIYIGNIFRMQQLYRKHEKLTMEVKELRAKSLTIAAEKMNATRQSNIVSEVNRRNLPLRESLRPNRVIPK